MAKNKKTRNEIRQENYNKLRSAGYTSKDANNLKGRKQETIKQLVKEKKEEIRKEIKTEMYHIARDKGYSSKEAKKISNFGNKKREVFLSSEITPENKENILKSIVELPSRFSIPAFINVEDYQKKYLEPFSYVVGYKREDGSTDYITVTSLKPLTPAELQDTVHQYFKEGENEQKAKYVTSKIIYNSIYVDVAIFNEGKFDAKYLE